MMKDFFCLPRPLSPPLQRITISTAPALEYGFPSTHSTNAVSVGLVCLSQIFNSHMYAHSSSLFEQALCRLGIITASLYMFSIVLGRVYCGMHGFLDILVGTGLGVALWWLRISFGPQLDAWVCQSSILGRSVNLFLWCC